MKKMLLELLANLNKNCEGVTGVDGEPLRNEVENIIDIVGTLPNDADVEQWKKDAHVLSWVGVTDMGG